MRVVRLALDDAVYERLEQLVEKGYFERVGDAILFAITRLLEMVEEYEKQAKPSPAERT